MQVNVMVQSFKFIKAISSQKGQLMKTQKQLINKRWRDPRDLNDSEHYNKRRKVRH